MQGWGSHGAKRVGRYAILDEIASGGMATVHLGRDLEAGSASSAVAIKRMHAHFAKDPEFLSMFTDEARVATRIRHPNVVATLDVVSAEGELFLVMEVVLGESLGKLLRACRERGEQVPPPIATAVVAGVLHGLHAAHEATHAGELLHIVHRDVSPQNVLVGMDGVARVLDFGVAKARGRLQTTREGQLKGKLSYMAPEQLETREIDRRTDVFSAGAVLWEVLIGKRLFDGMNEAAVLRQIMEPKVAPPSEINPDLAPFDAIVAKALAGDPADRFESADAMAVALEAALDPALPREVGAWVERLGGPAIARRAKRVGEIERLGSSSFPAHEAAGSEPAPVRAPTSVPRPTPRETPRDAAPPSTPRPTESQEAAPFAAALEPSDPPPAPLPIPDAAAVDDDLSAETLPLHDRGVPLSTPPSQVSSISSQLSVPPPLPPDRVRMLAVVGLGAASVVALSLTLLLSLTSRPKVRPAAATALPIPSALTSSAPEPTDTPAAAPASVEPADTAAPVPSESSDAVPPDAPPPTVTPEPRVFPGGPNRPNGVFRPPVAPSGATPIRRPPTGIKR